MTGRRVRMLALHPLWRKARRVYSLASRLPGTNRLGFQPSLALSVCMGDVTCSVSAFCSSKAETARVSF
ncbi:MAG: hypothetical protein LC539_20115 [Candidatus Thiodiazotropha sp.]|nr:hypothetical protein [Candidatus Thiodiazotropha sp.]